MRYVNAALIVFSLVLLYGCDGFDAIKKPKKEFTVCNNCCVAGNTGAMDELIAWSGQVEGIYSQCVGGTSIEMNQKCEGVRDDNGLDLYEVVEPKDAYPEIDSYNIGYQFPGCVTRERVMPAPSFVLKVNHSFQDTQTILAQTALMHSNAIQGMEHEHREEVLKSYLATCNEICEEGGCLAVQTTTDELEKAQKYLTDAKYRDLINFLQEFFQIPDYCSADDVVVTGDSLEVKTGKVCAAMGVIKYLDRKEAITLVRPLHVKANISDNETVRNYYFLERARAFETGTEIGEGLLDGFISAVDISPDGAGNIVLESKKGFPVCLQY